MVERQPKASPSWENRQKWLQMPFPLDEYQRRVERLQAAMAKEGLDAMLLHGMPARSGPVRYIANFYSFLGNTLVVVPVDEEPAMVTETVFHGEPMHAMIWSTWLKDVRYSDFPIAPTMDEFMAELKAVFREKGLEKARVGLVGGRWMPAILMNALSEAFPAADFRSAARLYRDVTAIKSPREIQLLTRANLAAGKAFAAAYESARPGVTEIEIAAEVRYAMAKAGADEIWDPLAVAAGPRSGFKHSSPTDRPIENGDMIFVDISPIFSGYIVDVSRTWVIGKGDPEAVKMLDAALAAEDAALEKIKPGATGLEAHEAATRVAERFGLAEWFYAVGHGVGSTKFESPMLTHAKGAPIDVVFEPGMVFSLEEMFVREGLGTAVIEDTILVTETGAEILPCYERKLW